MASDQLTTCRYVHMISLTKIGMFVKQVRSTNLVECAVTMYSVLECCMFWQMSIYAILLLLYYMLQVAINKAFVQVFSMICQR